MSWGSSEALRSSSTTLPRLCLLLLHLPSAGGSSACQPPAARGEQADPWKYLGTRGRADTSLPQRGCPAPITALFSFLTPPRSVCLAQLEEIGGKSWALATVNTEHSDVAAGQTEAVGQLLHLPASHSWAVPGWDKLWSE